MGRITIPGTRPKPDTQTTTPTPRGGEPTVTGDVPVEVVVRDDETPSDDEGEEQDR